MSTERKASTGPAGATRDTHARLMRWSVALVWAATGLFVLSPDYRMIGERWLARWDLPPWLMWGTCAFELALGLRLLALPAGRALSVLQIGMVLTFTAILATLEPMLLVHPLGVLSKNLPFIGVVAVVALVERGGWNARALWLLRVAMAVVWLTEGIGPKILFQQPWELAIATTLQLPGEPSHLVAALGVAQALSGVAALTLRGRPLRWLLAAQVATILALSAMVGWLEPRWWLHPFGPLTKNLPILAGTYAVWRRC